MRGRIWPTHQRAAWRDGYCMGRNEMKREQSYLLPAGISIGIPIGVLIVWGAQWLAR